MSRIVITDIDDTPVSDEPEAWEGVKRAAGEIARTANQTSAKIGTTYRERGSGKDKHVLLTSRGAAAIPVEFGHQGIPGKKPVRRAIDRHRQ